jgi:macrocin-O-methyltransferase TylF-like protien
LRFCCPADRRPCDFICCAGSRVSSCLTIGGEVAPRRFSFGHIDVDLYEPTRHAVEFFYPRLNDGGILVFDDFGFTTCPGAMVAIKEATGNISDQVIALPDGGGFLIKGRSVARAAKLTNS